MHITKIIVVKIVHFILFNGRLNEHLLSSLLNYFLQTADTH